MTGKFRTSTAAVDMTYFRRALGKIQSGRILNHSVREKSETTPNTFLIE